MTSAVRCSVDQNTIHCNIVSVHNCSDVQYTTSPYDTISAVLYLSSLLSSSRLFHLSLPHFNPPLPRRLILLSFHLSFVSTFFFYLTFFKHLHACKYQLNLLHTKLQIISIISFYSSRSYLKQSQNETSRIKNQRSKVLRNA
jgi:hypothetical protein